MKSDEIKRYRRFNGWDYAKGASLFITIATESRQPFFGRIENGRMRLSKLGQEVNESLEAIPRLNPGISLFGHVVMPDHVHFNCHLAAGMQEPLKVLGNAIRRFKNYTAQLAKHSLAISTEADSRGEAVEDVRTLSEDGRTAHRKDSSTAFSGDGRTVFEQNIFLTGATGFFGKSMLDYRQRHPEWPWAKARWVILSRSPEKFIAENSILARQPGVSFIEGDVRDFVFPKGRFDAIIHAATSAVTTLDDEEMTSVILDGTRRVIDFAEANGCMKLLFASSGAVYGPRSSPASEDDECLPVTAYGKGKLQAERMLLDSGLDVKIARCFAFVGPYLPRTIHYAIGNFIQNCLDGRPIVINGDGTPRRSYMSADDLVEWLFAILERGESGRAYNVGADRAVSILEIAQLVRAALGSKSEIIVKGVPKCDEAPSVYVPSIVRAREELGLSVKVPLEKAIRLSV